MAEGKDKPKVGRRSDVDWPAIERDYCLGQLTVRELGRKHGVSASAITRKAEKQGWTQDISEEVRTKTRAELLKNKRNTENATRKRNKPTPDEIAEAVQTNVALVREHRKDIGAARAVAQTLLGQLQETSLSIEEIEELIIEETEAPDGEAESKAEEQARLKRRQKMLAAVNLQSRAQTLGNLAAAYQKIVALERQAFGIDAPDGGKSSEPIKAITDDMSVADAAALYAQTLIAAQPSEG